MIILDGIIKMPQKCLDNGVILQQIFQSFLPSQIPQQNQVYTKTFHYLATLFKFQPLPLVLNFIRLYLLLTDLCPLCHLQQIPSLMGFHGTAVTMSLSGSMHFPIYSLFWSFYYAIFHTNLPSSLVQVLLKIKGIHFSSHM